MGIKNAILLTFTILLCLSISACQRGAAKSEQLDASTPIADESPSHALEANASPSELSTPKQDVPEVDKHPLMPDIISYYDGRDSMDSFQDNDLKLYFKKDHNLSYGFYFPDNIEEYVLEDGTEWGLDNQRSLFSLFELGDIGDRPFNFENPFLVQYSEYTGSERDDAGITYDYFRIHDVARERDLVVRMRYRKEQQDMVLPMFLTALGTMRYYADPKEFKPGVAIELPEGSDEAEKQVNRMVKQNLAATVARDKEAFHATITEGMDFLDFLLDSGRQYRFDRLVSIDPYDEETGRRNITISFEYLEHGVVQRGTYMYTLLKSKKDDVWKIANIN
jgi:hypothetical protein